MPDRVIDTIEFIVDSRGNHETFKSLFSLIMAVILAMMAGAVGPYNVNADEEIPATEEGTAAEETEDGEGSVPESTEEPAEETSGGEESIPEATEQPAEHIEETPAETEEPVSIPEVLEQAPEGTEIIVSSTGYRGSGGGHCHD